MSPVPTLDLDVATAGLSTAPPSSLEIHPFRSALLLGLAYAALASASLYLSRQPGSIATIWYPNALAVAVLMHAPSGLRSAGLWLAVALAMVAANLAWGPEVGLALSFLPANLLEMAIGVWLLRRARLHEANLRSPWTVLRLLLLGGVLPQLAGATAGAAALGWSSAQPWTDNWLNWFEGSVLGSLSLLVLASLSLRTPPVVRRQAMRHWRLAALLPITVAIVLWALSTVRFPFIYVSLPLLLGAMLLPMLSAHVLTLAASVCGAVAIATGLFVPPPVQAHWEQGYIYLAFASALLPAQLLASTLAALKDGRAALEARTRELERANERLEQFVHMASHDLREPLNTLTQFGHLLQEDARDRLGSDSQEYLRLMSHAGTRMRRLLDDVLRYARLGRGEQDPFVAADLQQILQEVMDGLAGTLKASGGRVEIGALPLVMGHPALLSLMFQNLVANALKFVPADRPPVVVVSAERRRGDHVITVQDNGIGIAEGDRARLFRPFSRLHPQRLYEGTGLGLSLCQQIAQMHGGRIELESTPGEGSTFRVILPA